MDSITVIVLIIAGTILLFLAAREITTWYFKIDTIIKNQQRQIDLLAEILKEYRGETAE